MLGIQTDGFILTTLEWLGAISILSPKIDVAAGERGTFSRAGDRDRVAIYIADVNVVVPSSAAFDLAICRVIDCAKIDTPCPSGGVDDCGCGSKWAGLRSANRVG